MSKKLIEEARSSKATIGHAGLGLRGETVMTPAFAAHDGDTVFARVLTNISIHFLGVDTAGVAFTAAVMVFGVLAGVQFHLGAPASMPAADSASAQGLNE